MSPLPAVLAEYFRADDAGDTDAVVGCFTADAAVIDDGRRYQGRDEITEWRWSLAAAPFEYTVEVLDVRAASPEHYVLATRTTGSFPGGTVDLVYDATLRDGLIASLRIETPTPSG